MFIINRINWFTWVKISFSNFILKSYILIYVVSDNILLHPFAANLSLFICLLIRHLGNSFGFVQSARPFIVEMFSFFCNIEKLKSCLSQTNGTAKCTNITE